VGRLIAQREGTRAFDFSGMDARRDGTLHARSAGHSIRLGAAAHDPRPPVLPREKRK
jgi:hypothetical protein